MRKLYRTVSTLLVALFAVSMFSFIGCTKYANEQELLALEEQKQAAVAAEKTVEERKKEKAKLESELLQKKKELQDAKKELENVKRRLAE